ncbi:hypothetical protein OIU85_017667 [Salix viminalis]|uniref:Uncharacterized protein n=1 Tax=Salix viminalis TaxID=40686 RepID=A0A9Q0V7V0_SALVM|nr:hypothetical protein OIU85_017667 [Salix viminalis]
MAGYGIRLERNRSPPSSGQMLAGRRYWVSAMMKDNDKKNVLAVQTLRNLIMGSTLMATTSILLSAGLAAIISSTYSVKKPQNDAVYGAHGEFMVALKYVTLLTIFMFSFFCHSLSIRFVNQVNLLINTPPDPMSVVNSEYVSELLEKGFVSEHSGEQALLLGDASPALDIWASPCFPVFCHHGPSALQLRLCVW